MLISRTPHLVKRTYFHKNRISTKGKVGLNPPMRCISRLRLKCYGTCAETRFRLSAKRANPFKSVEASVQSTTGSRGVRISGSNAGYTMFRGSVKDTGHPLHSPVSPSLLLLCVTVCHHISTGLYLTACLLRLSDCYVVLTCWSHSRGH
jgi:hypothetical protein